MTLLRALARSRGTHSTDLELAITGHDYGEGRRLKAAAEDLGLTDCLHLVGYVEPADLKVLYAEAALYASPSLFEGFGLTPIEAMACGAPVAVSDRASLPEVAGLGALVLPAEDVDAWAEAFSKSVLDPAFRDRLRRRGADHCQKFTWRTCAETTLAAYEKAASLA